MVNKQCQLPPYSRIDLKDTSSISFDPLGLYLSPRILVYFSVKPVAPITFGEIFQKSIPPSPQQKEGVRN